MLLCRGIIYVSKFDSDEGLRDKEMAAAAAEGERMWQMPLDEDYKDYLKSAFADLPNIGGRGGGAVTAAHLLQEVFGSPPPGPLGIAGAGGVPGAPTCLCEGAARAAR